MKLMLDAQDLKVLKARHTSDAQELRVNEVEEAEEDINICFILFLLLNLSSKIFLTLFLQNL